MRGMLIGAEDPCKQGKHLACWPSASKENTWHVGHLHAGLFVCLSDAHELSLPQLTEPDRVTRT